jgi:GNAT superfamily N-acetyltransferase
MSRPADDPLVASGMSALVLHTGNGLHLFARRGRDPSTDLLPPGSGGCSVIGVKVRKATRGDLIEIGRVADAAHWGAYSGLLAPSTITRLLQRDFAPGPLKRRLLSGQVVVAESAGSLVGFADAEVQPGSVKLTALSTEPESRRRGIGRALLAAVRGMAPDLPVSADVLLGSLEVERFFESQGFVPGETLNGMLFDEPVVERRWWLPPGDPRQ